MTPLTPAGVESMWAAFDCPSGYIGSLSGLVPVASVQSLCAAAAREHGRQGGACPYTVPELVAAWTDGRDSTRRGCGAHLPVVMAWTPTEAAARPPVDSSGRPCHDPGHVNMWHCDTCDAGVAVAPATRVEPVADLQDDDGEWIHDPDMGAR